MPGFILGSAPPTEEEIKKAKEDKMNKKD